MKRILLFACVIALCILLVPGNAQAATTYKKQTFLIATTNPLGSLHATALEKFREIVEKESAGAITVKTFYGGSMGDEQANVKQLRTGELHVACLYSGNFSPFAPTASIFSLPYIFPNIQDAYKIFSNKAYMAKLTDIIVKQSNTRPLGWAVGGYRYLTNSKHPILKIDDLKGLKFRVSPADTQLESFRAWGVDPHPMAWSETFNALQQGVVDGQENPHSVNRDQKFWEVQKYITEIHYILWTGPILASESWYRKLDQDTRALVDKAGLEAQGYEWKWSEEQEEVAKQDCIKHGMVVNQVTDEAVWQEKARSIWPKFYDKIGGKALVDEAVAIVDGK
jgi:tripartite ATP-independent transporter DctP family solute receptor